MEKNHWTIALLMGLILTGCGTPKVIEQHQHHYYEADTQAIQAKVDAHLQSWHEQMDSAFRQQWSQYASEQSLQEQEHEKVTETVTSWVDSLGRVVRQEQRTTERDLSRQQQQREERLTREFEVRLQQALAQHDSIWQYKYDQMQVHWQQEDSISNSQTPVAVNEDNRPWYKRMASALGYISAGCLLLGGIIVTRKWWMKLLG